MHDGALSNYTETEILKGPSVLEAGHWSMAGPSLSVHTPTAHLSTPHFPILYVSLCLKGVDGKQRRLQPNVMTTWQGTAPACVSERESVSVCLLLCSSLWSLGSGFNLLRVRSIVASLWLLSHYRLKPGLRLLLRRNLIHCFFFLLKQVKVLRTTSSLSTTQTLQRSPTLACLLIANVFFPLLLICNCIFK